MILLMLFIYNYDSSNSNLVSHSKSNNNNNNNNNNFKSHTQGEFYPITFGEIIPQEKIRENESYNISVVQNDVHSTSMYINILMDSITSASIIHYLFVNSILEKLSQISGPR